MRSNTYAHPVMTAYVVVANGMPSCGFASHQAALEHLADRRSGAWDDTARIVAVPVYGMPFSGGGERFSRQDRADPMFCRRA